MQLKEILSEHYPSLLNAHNAHCEILSISCDSRRVEPDGLFVALRGYKADGADFIPSAIHQGAKVIAASRESCQRFAEHSNAVCYLPVDDPQTFLRQVAKKFYGDPSRKIKVIGVTGTNGKTTLTYLLESVLTYLGKACGVVGTINRRLGNRIWPTDNTTPGFLDNQKFLSELVQNQADYCAMEVSSHGLDQGRVDLIDFSSAIFTNLTGDHLDYHKTFENYFQAKAKLFTGLSPQASAIINIDDAYGQRLCSMTKASIVTYGLNKGDVHAEAVSLKISGSQLRVVTPQGAIALQTALVGRHNIYNILAAIGACLSQNIKLENIVPGIERFKNVPGRLERVDYGQPFSIFIDYAHTQDALENVLLAIKQTTASRIILVFGCGGDRDKTKRPLMGAVADQLADWSIVTSDNPRSEDPQEIIDQILPGFKRRHYEVVVNREEAIKAALAKAIPGDVVLIAGKGHETYQIFKDQSIHFDERELIQKYIPC
jgi:UDP-N-acetylmuramoyl-L-alanyl-D-glutamate--2,6-diaminopimelate ligase